MIDININVKTAGAYVLFDGYFVFMFGFGNDHTNNELGIVRLGGHCEINEHSIECIIREIKEESSLDITFFKNKITYYRKNNSIEYEKAITTQEINPILVLNGSDNKYSVMYLTYGHGKLVPQMETQGILLLRKEDVEMICTKNVTLKEYKENGGKFLLAKELPENAVLLPHIQLRFLHDLFELEEDMMENYMKMNKL